MDDINIFIIGVLVTILSLIGVIYTIVEFREMSRQGGHGVNDKKGNPDSD